MLHRQHTHVFGGWNAWLRYALKASYLYKRPAAALVRRGLGSVRRCKTVWDLPPLPPSIPDATSRISARRLIRFGPHV
jgi:hypothetical protein